jgi:hypothetical protein
MMPNQAADFHLSQNVEEREIEIKDVVIDSTTCTPIGNPKRCIEKIG